MAWNLKYQTAGITWISYKKDGKIHYKRERIVVQLKQKKLIKPIEYQRSK
jgi:hypothetical protein